MNIRIEFLYRDASNYKRCSEAVFGNPGNLAEDEAWRELRDAAAPWRLFDDMIHFQPELVGLDTCFLTDAGFEEDDDDLDLHELHRVSLTSDASTDARSVQEFIRDLERAGRSTPNEGVSWREALRSC